MKLATEADVLRALRTGTYTLDDLYGLCEQRTATDRAGGQDEIRTAAEDAGLTWVSSIVARKTFPLATIRRPASAHWTITVMTSGRLGDRRRVFNPPEDQPRAASGHPYPLDWWSEGNGRADRPKLVRYDNALPLPLVRRIVGALSNPGEHVVDPFLGSGTSAVACWELQRRFTGGDVNQAAVRFAAARLLAEHAWPADEQPRLFEAAPAGPGRQLGLFGAAS